MITKIDNVLGKNEFREIQYRVLDPELPWYFGGSTAYKGVDSDLHDFSFSHLIFNKGEAISPLFDSMLMSFLHCADRAGQNIEMIYRLRLGLITPTDTSFVHAPHIDFDDEHMTGLLYFNDSDGDTILYDNFYDFGCGMASPDYVKTLTLKEHERHKPVANTFVSFEGNRYHSSSTPTTTKRRVVLNVNYSIVK